MMGYLISRFDLNQIWRWIHRGGRGLQSRPCCRHLCGRHPCLPCRPCQQTFGRYRLDLCLRAFHRIHPCRLVLSWSHLSQSPSRTCLSYFYQLTHLWLRWFPRTSSWLEQLVPLSLSFCLGAIWGPASYKLSISLDPKPPWKLQEFYNSLCAWLSWP